MTVRIRLARGGTKKRPFYRIVATTSSRPRDGAFLEKLGTYNPILPSDSSERIVLREERIRYWLGVGAQPSDRVARFLDNAGITQSATRWRGTGKKAQEIAAKKAEAAAAAADAAPAVKTEPVETKAAPPAKSELVEAKPAEPEPQVQAAAEDVDSKAADAEAAPEAEEAPEPAAEEVVVGPNDAAKPVDEAPAPASTAESETAPETPAPDESAKPAGETS